MEVSAREKPTADLQHLCNTVLSQRRLILATNRGPVEHQVTADGRTEARRGSGGVVTALNSLTQMANFTWIASAMGEGDRVVSNQGQAPSIKSPLPGHKINLRYVVTPRRVYHKYYNIVCNPLLWFLQHYMWNPPYNPNVDASVHDAWQGGYVPVNQAFARAVVEEAKDETQPPIIVSHDYHLYLVPKYVREELPDTVIQHFVHIPWPTPRYWQMVPGYIVREICDSLCRTDLIGFQTPEDRQSFLDTVEHFLPDAEVDRQEHLVRRNGQSTEVRVYPISINVAEVQRIAGSPRALEYEEKLRPLCNDATIVRVDRAEPNKNVVRGFKAYELLLSRHPELQGKVTFLAFLVLSRTHIRQYQRYMDEIQQLIDQINRNYSTEDWQPIHAFLENNYSQAVAGMKLYDVLLVNTIIDGMNLVAKEGPVVNTKNGVLVLSESSGSHPQLMFDALSVSPTDIEGTMETLYRAVNMSSEERQQRASNLYEMVRQEDINHWLCRQLEDIGKLL